MVFVPPKFLHILNCILNINMITNFINIKFLSPHKQRKKIFYFRTNQPLVCGALDFSVRRIRKFSRSLLLPRFPKIFQTRQLFCQQFTSPCGCQRVTVFVSWAWLSCLWSSFPVINLWTKPSKIGMRYRCGKLGGLGVGGAVTIFSQFIWFDYLRGVLFIIQTTFSG